VIVTKKLNKTKSNQILKHIHHVENAAEKFTIFDKTGLSLQETF
jgi:hypothetical protein